MKIPPRPQVTVIPALFSLVPLSAAAFFFLLLGCASAQITSSEVNRANGYAAVEEQLTKHRLPTFVV